MWRPYLARGPSVFCPWSVHGEFSDVLRPSIHYLGGMRVSRPFVAAGDGALWRAVLGALEVCFFASSPLVADLPRFFRFSHLSAFSNMDGIRCGACWLLYSLIKSVRSSNKLRNENATNHRMKIGQLPELNCANCPNGIAPTTRTEIR